MPAAENQIVVYQPNGVMKIDVRFDGETVWLLQPQIAELFSCSIENVGLHLKNIYARGELEKAATSKESLEVRKEGRRNVNLGFRPSTFKTKDCLRCKIGALNGRRGECVITNCDKFGRLSFKWVSDVKEAA
ncbi:MAG: hypothetical protein IJ658_08990 [Kiritimatiellae bacterium]|nr:hypothetical protein [Kiritimatiellia bacterium]